MGGLGVDLIVTLDGRRIANEAKDSNEVFSDSVASILKLQRDYEPSIAYLGAKSKKLDGIRCHPWDDIV
jgi:hypothetical protein